MSSKRSAAPQTCGWRYSGRFAQKTRVCVYDRAGLGYSDSPRKRRPAKRMAAELHTLLRKCRRHALYILAGHSMDSLTSVALTDPEN